MEGDAGARQLNPPPMRAGLSRASRALEQMIPDVRFTPNPNDAPGGPLIERGDRNC